MLPDYVPVVQGRGTYKKHAILCYGNPSKCASEREKREEGSLEHSCALLVRANSPVLGPKS